MSSPTGVPDDDAYWQRPEPGSTSPGPAPRSAPEPDPTPRYAGPPKSAPPPPQWRPPTIAQPAPPRAMPPQDIDALEDAEGSARTVTFGIGLVAGAIALLLLCLLCGRILF
nr:translation initiation factor 2 [uncultured Actinoplanes sp.]